jgi:hypothetical protein
MRMERGGWLGLLWKGIVIIGVAHNYHVSNGWNWLPSRLLSLALFMHVVIVIVIGVWDENGIR